MPHALSFALAALLAAPAAVSTTPAPADPPGDVLGWLQPLAGQAAVACGTVHAARPESSPLACATNAIEQSKPFWIVLDTHDTPAAWTGIVRNAEGKAWSVSFGPRSVTVLSCASILVEPAGLRCIA